MGEGVTAFAPGDRVMGRCDGAFAEMGCMASGEAHPVPAGMPWEQAACTTVVYSTVHDMLIAQGRLEAGECLLVTGVSSGVGVGALALALLKPGRAARSARRSLSAWASMRVSLI